MTNQHPITPPPELQRLWAQQAQRLTPHDITGWLDYVAAQAARWGSDQELEACCAEVAWLESSETAKRMRERRRSKPPTLKEQALTAMLHLQKAAETNMDTIEAVHIICRALEELP